jgi:hypothetical protein
MGMKHNLATGTFVELLDGNTVGVKGLDHRVCHFLNRRHHRIEIIRCDIKHVPGCRFGNNQAMPVRTRHDVRDRNGLVVFVNLVAGQFTAQNFGEYVAVVLGS